MVKSTPELWAECSNAASLARHLGQFGEISITRLEPETAVAWEGSAARGTVRLEPAGWGTKVILTATEQEVGPEPAAEEPREPEAAAEPEPASEPAPQPEAEAATEPAPELSVRRGFFARMMSRLRTGPPPAPFEPPPEPEPELEPEPEPEPQLQLEPQPAPAAGIRAGGNPLDAALDSLGSAHHRPYSRA